MIINLSYANNQHYFIKLGSFKNLNGLKQSIQQLPHNLRSNITIIRKNSWYIPFAYYGVNRNRLYRYVPQFKHFFPDAHVHRSSRNMFHYPIIKNYRKRETRRENIKRRVLPQYPPKRTIYPPQRRVPFRPQPSYYQRTQPLPIAVSIPIYEKKKVVQRAVVPSVKIESNPNYFTNRILSGKHYFLTYKSTKESPNLLIKVTFKTHTVTYQPIIGEMKMTQANYLVENKKLYMFANNFTENGAYSKLEERHSNYLLVSSWVNGKKLNSLRYYFDLNQAKEYLNLEVSKGLANVLEEGIYDEFFLDDDY